MSAIAKILIVLNLLLAVAFLGAAATFLGQQESWKFKHTELNDKYTRETKELNDALTSVRNKNRELEQNASQAQSSLTALQSRFDQKETDYTQLSNAQNELIAKYNSLSATYDDIVAQNKQLAADKDRLVNEKDQAMSERRAAIDDKNNATTEQKRLEGEIEDLNTQIAELNKRLVANADELESANIKLEAYRKQVGELPNLINPPKLDGKVTGVDNDLNIVLLSIGRDDDVKPGFTFTVYRGNEYVGKIMIDKVEKDYASGYSMKELQKHPIEVGDDVTTGF
jgi:TolA-binding protein